MTYKSNGSPKYMNKLYKCITKCPELDLDNEYHCIIQIKNNEELLDLQNSECPCGNKPEWKEI